MNKALARVLRGAGIGAILLLPFAGRSAEETAPAKETPVPAEKAQAPFRLHGDAVRGGRIYQGLCLPCHGARGDGKGPLAEKLNAPTPDFTDAEAMLAKDDAALYDVVREGGSCHGKSGLMQAWEQTLSEQELHDVLSYIRTLATPMARNGGETAL